LWLSFLCLANEYEIRLKLGRCAHSKATEQSLKEMLSIVRACSMFEGQLEQVKFATASGGSLVSRLNGLTILFYIPWLLRNLVYSLCHTANSFPPSIKG